MSEATVIPYDPGCDFCKEVGESNPALYDCRTTLGPWAYVCQTHFEEYGPSRLGTGFGQRLIRETPNDSGGS